MVWCRISPACDGMVGLNVGVACCLCSRNCCLAEGDVQSLVLAVPTNRINTCKRPVSTRHCTSPTSRGQCGADTTLQLSMTYREHALCLSQLSAEELAWLVVGESSCVLSPRESQINRAKLVTCKWVSLDARAWAKGCLPRLDSWLGKG